VLGSVAERVVRSSPAPVMTVHASPDSAVLAGGMGRFRHIVAPTDLSDPSRRSLDLAVHLAIEFGAALTIVYVHELLDAQGEATRDNVAHVRCRLNDLLAGVRLRIPRATVVVQQGGAWLGILDTAHERQADLVVLATRGRCAGRRAAIGSTAEKIVRLSPIPVITVGKPAKG
jgi:nucleotide-binding universal stress UspA family protein